MAYFERLRFINDHSAYLCSLIIYGWMRCMLSMIIASSFVYFVVVHVEEDVLKWYPIPSFYNHLMKRSRNMIIKYMLKICPCIVLLLIPIGSVVPKWLLVNDVVDFCIYFRQYLLRLKGS